jgi:hypothetical protein
MPDYKEVTITIVEGENTARVWTNIRRWQGALKRLGAKPDPQKQATGEWFTCPQEWFWPRRKRRVKGGHAPGRFAPKTPTSAVVSKQSRPL